MTGFTVCKIWGADKAPCSYREKKKQKRKEAGFILGLVYPLISLQSLKGPLRQVEQSSSEGRLTSITSAASEPAKHTPKKANERLGNVLCVSARTSPAPSFVYNPINVTKVTLPQDNPPRSLCAPADLFSLLSFCDQVSAEFPWCADDGFHVGGFLMVSWPSEQPIQTPCKRLHPKVHNVCLQCDLISTNSYILVK